MTNLALFVPLAKADAAQRLVYGFFDETPDRSGEIFDYASSKPLIQAWSETIAKASDGKSLGNIRAQHGRNACGKLIDISFDDAMKKVGFCAKIVDDAEWAKVEEGVYTGFSPGGTYAKRWSDGAHNRYTADVRELSIVDVPCNPSATFTMVKTDGAEERVAFVTSRAYEPGNEATLARAELLAKAANRPGMAKDYVVRARAELIGEAARAELRKLAEDASDDEEAEKAFEEKPDAAEGEAYGQDKEAVAPVPTDKLAAALKQAIKVLQEAAASIELADPGEANEDTKEGDAPPEDTAKGEDEPEDGALVEENAKLAKAVEDSTAGIGRLTAAVARLTLEKSGMAEELTRLRALPAPTKGAIFEISKLQDAALAKADGDGTADAALPMEVRALQLRLRR